MSTEKVYNALQASLTDNTIDLWAAANHSADLAGMSPVFTLLNVNSAYTLTLAVLTKSADEASVRLTGNGFFTGATSYPVSVVLLYKDDGNVFSLMLSLNTDWVFSDFFSPLPPTMMENPSVGIGTTWYNSILEGMSVLNAVFTAATGNTMLQLTGLLQLPDSVAYPIIPYLLAKIPMIEPWPLSLSGTVQLPDSTHSYPIIELYARGNDTIINSAKEPGISDGPTPIPLLNPGLMLQVQKQDPPEPGVIAFSTIRVFADFALGELKGRLTTLIMSMGDVWALSAVFDKTTSSLVQGLSQLAHLFGVELPIPMNFPILSDFYIAEVDIDLQNTAEGTIFPSFTLLSLAVTIQSDRTWDPPLPLITLDKVGTRWLWGWTEVDDGAGSTTKTYSLTGSVFGTVSFNRKGQQPLLSHEMPLDVYDNPVAFDTIMSIPNFIISGSLSEESYIPIGKALAYFLGNEGPSTGLQKMNITRLKFSADPIGQNYMADGSILFGDPLQPDLQQGWEINLFFLTIVLNELSFNVEINNGQVYGGISGILFLNQGDPLDDKMPRILLAAAYPPADPGVARGWELTGMLYPGTSISLTKLVYQFINGSTGSQPPTWIPDVTIDQLYAVFTTGSEKKVDGVVVSKTNPTYIFKATISTRWKVSVFNKDLTINAAVAIDMAKPEAAEHPNGTITGMFSVNKLMLTVSLSFGVPEPTYLFKVQFEELWLQATTSWRGAQDKRHQVVSVQLGGITLGDILEYLVNLAAPTLGFKLGAPWDVLKKIDLSRFVLTIDPKDNIVEFVFNANVNIVIAQLDSIGVRYTRQSGEAKVEIILTGNFLGQAYTSDKPLSWDVVNDPPPAVPGQGNSVVKLRYVGIGQRVTFGGDTPDTVAQSIKKLKDDMKPPPSSGLPLSPAMQYSPDSQWLIGLDIQLMETLDLAIIFNDPKLYGLSIALSGERAGPLAGLRFEILYKKITDDIGMYRIELRVPDMFRTIQLGAVSITLGIIVVEIYTNGNFKVDLGFPYNRNFDRSFSLQAAIFIGRGGFYLGLLNGETSTQVPRITNGNFSPVIELGIGISAGVGREFSAGILAGGAYVQLEVIFQGVLAWFNPNSSGVAPATYFKCQGIAALHGKIYGSVDFVVVKVSLTLEAYAQVSILYESYQPMLIELSVSVSAEASIKILFIRIYFSFSVNLELSFTVGSAQPTPWILNAAGPSGKAALATPGYTRHVPLRTNHHRRMLALGNTHLTALSRQQVANGGSVATADDYILHWQPANPVFPDGIRNAHVTFLPQFVVADIPVNWDGTLPVNPDPKYRAAFVLLADTGFAVDAMTSADCHIRSAAHSGMATNAADTSQLAADILVRGLLLYAVNAYPRQAEQGHSITSWQLASLLRQLSMPDTKNIGLSPENLILFFSHNIHLWISGDPGTPPEEKSAMVLPLPPFLNWISAQGGNIDFNNHNPIGPWYEWGIAQLLNTYQPVGSETGPRPDHDDPQTYESFASCMFRDFCLMLIQNAVKEMQKQLTTSVAVTTVSSDATVIQNLAQVAATLPTASVEYTIQSGDTVESVAANLGATVEELLFLNQNILSDLTDKPVGFSLIILLGIPPEVLALDNAGLNFAVNQVILGTLVHQAAVDDTLQNIATLFQVADVTSLLQYSDTQHPILSTASNILLPGALFDLGQQTFINAPADFVQLRTAAVFYVRYFDLQIIYQQTEEDMANWYVEAIVSINPGLKDLFPAVGIPSVTELPPGQLLKVPNHYQAAYNTDTNCNTYTTIPGDTLNQIALALVLQQDFATSIPPNIPGWPAFRAGVVSAGSQQWTIPAFTGIKVSVRENITSLVRRLIIDAGWNNTAQHVEVVSWNYNWPHVITWLANAKILLPLACITVPNTKTAVTNPLNFAILSSTYGITVTDAATRLKNLHGLFAKDTVLTVKALPAQDIDVLVDAVLKGDSFVSIVNQSSRMLLSGLQLPGRVMDGNGHVIPATGSSFPLYDLTGQQFSLPVDSSQPDETALSLGLASEQDWISLYNSITAPADKTLTELIALYPDLLTYNPGLNASTYHTGMLLLTAPVTDRLDYTYTNQQILDKAPATVLSVMLVPAAPPYPDKMPVRGTTLRTYGLAHRIELQSPIPLAIPQAANQSPKTGNPGLWMLPSDLLQKAVAGVSTLYEILATVQGAPAGSAATQLNNTTFGTLLPFKIKALDNHPSQFNLIGVDTDKRTLLIALSKWLRQQGNDTTKAYLLLSPAPDTANTSGMTILAASNAASSLIKTNLSTFSVPPARQQERNNEENGDGSAVYFASLASLADFLTLLWEGSVVGGTGYYFQCGQDIPGSAFDQQGNITLQILVIAGTQEAPAPSGRSLLPFNNCALTGAGTNTAELSLYIESAGSNDASELTVQALLPPGNIGFRMLTPNPDMPHNSAAMTEKQQDIHNLYSLLGFSVAETIGSPFKAAASGMPVLPDPTDGSQEEPWQKARTIRQAREAGMMQETDPAPKPYRRYAQVIPISRFAADDNQQDVNGLPVHANDPYRGYGTQSVLPYANLVFYFSDVLGNRTGANGMGQGSSQIPVGYTDPLIGIGDWPSGSRQFTVVSSGSNAMIQASLSSRPSELIPSPSQAGDVHKDNWIQQQQRYSQIYYQMIQPGITGWIVSSLQYTSDPFYGNKGKQLTDISPLWKFAAGSYVFISALQQLLPAKPAAGNTLSQTIALYGVRYAELAKANADKRIQELFEEQLPVVPAYWPNVEHAPASALYKMPPKGWPLPASPATLLNMDKNNSLPLKLGTALVIPDKPVTTGSAQPTLSLQQIATQNFTGIELIAQRNSALPILATGFIFSMAVDETQNIEIPVDSAHNSLDLIAAAFADKGLHTTAAALALYNKDTDGMLEIEKAIIIDRYIVREREPQGEPDTLADNSSGVSSVILANANIDTPDIFDPGALIYFGNFDGVTVPAASLTLQQFADQYACPVELLLQTNADLPAAGFDLPGTLAWPDKIAAIRVPYTIRTGDKLDSIASSFYFDSTVNPAALQLALINEYMPGTILPGIALSIMVNSRPYTVNTGSQPASFSSILLSLQQEISTAILADIVTAIGSQADVLQPGALFLCPPAKIPQDCSPENILLLYGIAPATFASANAATQGLISAGIELLIPSNKGPVSVYTRENDTLNTLITRFASAGVGASAEQIVLFNIDTSFIKAGTPALLPPAEIHMIADIGQGGPYQSPIMPLQVSVRLIRPKALIYPDFVTPDGTGPVEMVQSDFPAPAKGDYLNFNSFISDITTILPQLRIGTAQVDGVAQDLWQVNFDTTGIQKVTLSKGLISGETHLARFFALTPLYNYLVTRSVSVSQLNTDGTLAAAQPVTFQGIDVELWARRFVEDMDRFLSGTYTLSVFDHPDMQSSLQIILEAKNELVTAVAEGLDAVLAIADSGKDAALVSARKALQQQLGVSIAKTYEASVLIQYDSIVDAAWQGQHPPAPARLYGNGNIERSDRLATEKVAGLSMIAAKTDLSQHTGYVNFLLMLDNPTFHKQVDGRFTYDISHLEYNISDAGLPDGYQSSDWLSFLPVLSLSSHTKPVALLDTDPGQITAPIPLKSFPDLPRIVGQQAVQSFPDGTKEVTKLALWDYIFTYSHQHAAQDYVIIKTEFNLTSPDSFAEADPELRDLFTELSRYITVADPLWNLLNGLTDPHTQVPPATIAAAVGTFASLVQNIATYWPARLPQSVNYKVHEVMTAAVSYEFSTRISYDDVGQFDHLMLSLVADGSPVSWPDAYVQLPDGHFYLLKKNSTASQAVYTVYPLLPPLKITFNGWPVIKLVWPQLNLASRQNARSKMHVQRNQDLIDNVRTNPRFIFSTDTIVAPGIVTPLNIFGKQIDITGLGNTLTEALDTAFTQLFEEDRIGQKITIALAYGIVLVKSDDPLQDNLVTFSPIGLYPDKQLSVGTAAALNTAVQKWKSDNHPVENGGEWIFSLKQYSQLTDGTFALLDIAQLIYRL